MAFILSCSPSCGKHYLKKKNLEIPWYSFLKEKIIQDKPTGKYPVGLCHSLIYVLLKSDLVKNHPVKWHAPWNMRTWTLVALFGSQPWSRVSYPGAGTHNLSENSFLPEASIAMSIFGVFFFRLYEPKKICSWKSLWLLDIATEKRILYIHLYILAAVSLLYSHLLSQPIHSSATILPLSVSTSGIILLHGVTLHLHFLSCRFVPFEWGNTSLFQS